MKKGLNYQKFQQKTLLAIDYGEKVTGLCLFNPTKDPFPLLAGRIIFKNQVQLANEIIRLISEENVEVVILGLPLLQDGKESPMAEKVRLFSQLLPEQIPHFFQDETLSTFEAKDRMRNSPAFNFREDPKRIDEVAASIILEDFLAN